MKLVTEKSLYDFDAWSGGYTTLNTLNDKLSHLEMDRLEAQIVEALDSEEGITDTTLNDFLWFETDTIAQMLGYSTWEEFVKNHGKEDLDDEEDED